MEMYNLTIIIPHKNTPNLLERCLDTIPNRDDIFVVIVDDCSDAELVDFNCFPGIHRNNTKVIFDKSKKGAGHARNIGLEYIYSKWVLFADSDDFFTSSFSDIIDEYLDSQSDLVFFSSKSVYSNDLTLEAPRANKLNKFIEQFLHSNIAENDLRYGFTEPWSKLIKAKLIKDNNIYFDEIRVANDYWFSVLLGYYARKIEASSQILYIVTLRSGSLSISSQTISNLLTRVAVSSKVDVFFKKHKVAYQEKFLPIWLWMILTKAPLLFFSEYLKLLKKDYKVFGFVIFRVLKYGSQRFFRKIK